MDEDDKKKKEEAMCRKEMLTVGKLIEYLKTQNPDACVVAFEMNSNAYIEQLPELPNHCICTVKEDRERETYYAMNQWFKDCEDSEKRTEEHVNEIYRYCKDDDVIIRF